jgi:hypothetical protein
MNLMKSQQHHLPVSLTSASALLENRVLTTGVEQQRGMTLIYQPSTV